MFCFFVFWAVGFHSPPASCRRRRPLRIYISPPPPPAVAPDRRGRRFRFANVFDQPRARLHSSFALPRLQPGFCRRELRLPCAGVRKLRGGGGVNSFAKNARRSSSPRPTAFTQGFKTTSGFSATAISTRRLRGHAQAGRANALPLVREPQVAWGHAFQQNLSFFQIHFPARPGPGLSLFSFSQYYVAF